MHSNLPSVLLVTALTAGAFYHFAVLVTIAGILA